MKIICHETEHPWISIEDFYDQQELAFIWEELEFLSYPWKLLPPDDTNSAVEYGEILKQNNGVFLDTVYHNRRYSNILSANRKVRTCTSNSIKEKGKLKILQNHDNWFFKRFRCYDDFTLLSYYENEDYYKPHEDSACITALTWLYKEPKRFTGGDLIFPDTNEVVECKNNKTILFPSSITHQVTEVKMDEKYRGKRLGRWCITQMLYSDSKQPSDYPKNL